MKGYRNKGCYERSWLKSRAKQLSKTGKASHLFASK